ncbi:hypothetical protein FFF34_008480 [Inquilinus sp. KBS0705]|nr:hypothetical protein FFF34_008480 [Inquilinus sp. KBS0705]
MATIVLPAFARSCFADVKLWGKMEFNRNKKERGAFVSARGPGVWQECRFSFFGWIGAKRTIDKKA